MANIAWQPQPGPQTALLECPVFDIFYGGARGGAKTDGCLGEWAKHAIEYPGLARGVFFRRELPMLEEAIERAKEIYIPLGGEWREQKKMFIMPGGSRLTFRPLENDDDAGKYLGHAYTRIYFEEITQWPSPSPVDRLVGTLRSAHGVPVGLRATGNPGGPGHQWVYDRYVRPNPGGYEVFIGEHNQERVFIPARVWDNKILLSKDPDYPERLKGVGSEALVKAWLDGNWDIIEGAYFEEFGPQHQIEPFEIPDHWSRFLSMDWGSYYPFSVGWWAVASESVEVGERTIPKGALIRYKEWYGAKKPNLGLKMSAEDVAAGILQRMGKPFVKFGVLDPSAFKHDGGPSVAERIYAASGLVFRKADNRRTGRHGAAGGWDQLRSRLRGFDDTPMIYCFNTCKDSIRTIPMLQHDANNPEDADARGEDHAADEWRYAVMSRPMVIEKPKDPEPLRGIESITLNDLWKQRSDELKQNRGEIRL